MNSNWDHLRFFNALAESETHSEAAKRLGVSHSTVQRHISALESELNVQLFFNTSSGFQLTDAGKTLYEETSQIPTALRKISSLISGADDQMAGSVSITVPDTVGHFLLPKILLEFQDQHPDITFSIKVVNKLSDIQNFEADLAIRTGAKAPEELIGRKVGKIRFAVCTSANYLAKHSLTADDVLSNAMHFIVLDDSFSNHLVNWMPGEGSPERSIITVNGFLSAWRLCHCGFGLTLLPSYILKHDAQLAEVPNVTVSIENPVWVLSHKDLRDSARIKSVRHHLVENLAKNLST